jgi:hypothetical protein
MANDTEDRVAQLLVVFAVVCAVGAVIVLRAAGLIRVCWSPTGC